MKEILELLEQLIPLWATLIFLALIYLINLYRQILQKRIELGEQTKNDLLGNIEVTVKVTELYKDEIRLLENKVKVLESNYSYLKESIESNELNLQMQPKLIETSGDLGELVTINIAQLPKYKNLLRILLLHGYNACSVRKNSEDDEQPVFKEEEQRSIWIGSNVPPITACHVLKLAKLHWNSLCYVYLTRDIENVKSEAHSIIFIGGNSATAENLNLRKWNKNDFEDLDLNWSQEKFHEKIRNRSIVKSSR